jgi:hypothetical protein
MFWLFCFSSCVNFPDFFLASLAMIMLSLPTVAAGCLLRQIKLSTNIKVIVKATPPVFSMLPCRLKLDKEKSKNAGLAQQNGRDIKSLTPAREECNKYDLPFPVSDWLIITIGPRGLLLVVAHLFALLG